MLESGGFNEVFDDGKKILIKNIEMVLPKERRT